MISFTRILLASLLICSIVPNANSMMQRLGANNGHGNVSKIIVNIKDDKKAKRLLLNLAVAVGGGVLINALRSKTLFAAPAFIISTCGVAAVNYFLGDKGHANTNGKKLSYVISPKNGKAFTLK